MMVGSLKMFLLVISFMVAGSCAEAAQQPIVKTRYGSVLGRYQTSSSGRPIQAFYNIPFAKPLVGPLRFKSPQAPDPWDGIRNGTSPSPACIQNDEFFLGAGVFGSEDCLYLNVFTPQLSRTIKLPVMFWIFGGAYTNGDGGSYGPDFLLNHDVVLVTSNYRLGPFGFLSTEDEAAPGNFALKDQVAALRWVKDNIATFGGDPDAITVFGESSGAGSCHFLALSPLAKGLFRRVIMQSGTALAVWGLARRGAAARNTRRLAALLGCRTTNSADMVDCLRGVHPYAVLDMDRHIRRWYAFPFISHQPVVEGEVEGSFLPKHPLHLRPHDVDWIIGVNDNDGTLWAAELYSNSLRWNNYIEDFNRIFPISIFLREDLPIATYLTMAIRNFYFASEGITLGNVLDIYSDALFHWNANEAVRLYRNISSVYYYYFTYRGKYRVSDPDYTVNYDLGAGHTDDLFYLFPKNPYYPANYSLPQKDIRIAQIMTKLWTNFAIYGNPSADIEHWEWPKVSNSGLGPLKYLEIGETLVVRKDPNEKRIQFWRSLPPFRA